MSGGAYAKVFKFICSLSGRKVRESEEERNQFQVLLHYCMPPPSWLLRALGRGIGVGWAAEGSLAVRLLMTDFSSFLTNLVT